MQHVLRHNFLYIALYGSLSLQKNYIDTPAYFQQHQTARSQIDDLKQDMGQHETVYAFYTALISPCCGQKNLALRRDKQEHVQLYHKCHGGILDMEQTYQLTNV